MSTCQREKHLTLLGIILSGKSLASIDVPAESRAPGPAASVRLASLGIQYVEGALCLGTVPEQSPSLRAERCLLLTPHHDSGLSWRREHGAGGRLPWVTPVPNSRTSGLLPKPDTAAWRGEVALWPSETKPKNGQLQLFLSCGEDSAFFQCCIPPEEIVERTTTETQ